MASSISAGTTSATALVHTADTTGALELKTNNGTVAVTIDTSQRTAFVAGTAALPAITTSGDTNTGIFFPAADTIAFAEGGTESMRITSSGDVGIGTSSPNAKLEIKAASASQRQLQLTHFNSTDGWYFTADDTGGVLKTSRAGSSGLNGEAMRIDSGGAVFINATSTGSFSAAAKLSVLGVTAEFAAVFRAPDTGNYIVLSCDNPNGQVGKIQTSGSATSFLTSSDYRLKEDIAPMTGALAKVALLKPVTYKWKVDGTAGQGFIAHELQEVVPDCVGGEKDAVTTYINEDGNEATRPAYQGIDTSFLVATLTAAIQEQQALITQQAAAIEALTTRITALEGTPA